MGTPKKYKPWTDTERIALVGLRQMLPAEVVGEKLGRSARAIYSESGRLKKSGRYEYFLKQYWEWRINAKG